MVTFARTIDAVRRKFEARGLGHVVAGVRRIRVVSCESYHNEDTRSIGLNPADLRKPYAAFHKAAYLLVHELGHEFALVSLTRADKQALRPLFGDYDKPYRRSAKPRVAGPDRVSRYAAVHPVEDFTETFAVCLWKDWDPEAVRSLMQGKSALCRRKMAFVEQLVRRESRRFRGNADYRKPGLPAAAMVRRRSRT